MAWEHDEEKCPLSAVDRRLEDVHRFWHQAERAYFDPDAFRVSIQAAIQTARTVTLVLQKNKHIIPNFEEWYAPLQDNLRVNALMKWMVDARNRIEKQGDLEAFSFVSAEIVASHLDEGPRIQVPAKLFDGARTLLKSIPTNAVGEHVKKNGILRIRRRWIENSLPDYELLDAVANAYGQLSQVVDAAHRQMRLSAPITTSVATGRCYSKDDRGGRLPCMIGHEDARTLDIWLATGKRLELATVRSPKIDLSEAPKLEKRYGFELRDMFADSRLAEDHARTLFAIARKMFEKDGYHITLAFLLCDGKSVALSELRPEEHGHKYMMMRSLAHEVQRIGADAVIVIGESWSAPVDPTNPYMRAADSPDRREFLTATVVSKVGNPLDLAAEILREKDRVFLGETMERTDGLHYAFAPFYKVWGKETPSDWGSMTPTNASAEAK